MKLRRSLNLPLLTLYGLGNILGAGIYVLIGKVSASAGLFTPLSFLIASILVATTAFTYSELSARYPRSAGEALYLFKAFGVKSLSLLIGLLIIATGVLSSAAIANGFVGYFSVFFNWNETAVIVGLLALLGLLAAWGIKQSVQAAALLTLIEILGLLVIIWVGQDHLGDLDVLAYAEQAMQAEGVIWIGILSGAFLAFYAFIGFEDMVNVAEEVIEPTKTMPRAIILSLIVSTVIYVLVALVSILAVSPTNLAGSAAPLALIYEQITGLSPTLVSLIGMLAVVNGALIQIIMASRVVFGMSQQGWLPGALARINAKTRTPIAATVLITLIILILALWLPMVKLAELTSLLILIIFSLMHLSLIRLKTSNTPVGANVKQYSIALPIIGLVTNASFVAFYLWV